MLIGAFYIESKGTRSELVCLVCRFSQHESAKQIYNELPKKFFLKDVGVEVQKSIQTRCELASVKKNNKNEMNNLVVHLPFDIPF